MGGAVAIKSMRVSSTSRESEARTKDFLKEAAMLSRLNHPNILFFMGVLKKAETVYLITEWCPGGTLYDRIYRVSHDS